MYRKTTKAIKFVLYRETRITMIRSVAQYIGDCNKNIDFYYFQSASVETASRSWAHTSKRIFRTLMGILSYKEFSLLYPCSYVCLILMHVVMFFIFLYISFCKSCLYR